MSATADAPEPGHVFSGVAQVIDGDTLDIAAGQTGGGDAVRVRLFGIDAPEIGQACTRDDGTTWNCGGRARAEAERRAGGRVLRCTARDRDPYGRTVATCRDSTGTDLGEALTEFGAAVAYRRFSQDYVAAEQSARLGRRGLWAGPVTAPSEYRAALSARTAEPDHPQGCAIKGNISASGRIFHSPGQRDYDRTRINVAAGERWFCSATEARAAGWRAARR